MIVEWAQGSLLVTLVLVALASLVLGMGLPVTASYIVLATLAPLIFDLISQSQLLEALQAGDLPSNVAATIGLFGGDPVIALQEMPLEMKQPHSSRNDRTRTLNWNAVECTSHNFLAISG